MLYGVDWMKGPESGMRQPVTGWENKYSCKLDRLTQVFPQTLTLPTVRSQRQVMVKEHLPVSPLHPQAADRLGGFLGAVMLLT